MRGWPWDNNTREAAGHAWERPAKRWREDGQEREKMGQIGPRGSRDERVRLKGVRVRRGRNAERETGEKTR